MNEKPTHIDLFSGIGGFALAAAWAGFRTVAFCEIIPYRRRVLQKYWPEVPIHHDIRELDGRQFRGAALVTGGFPCQPYSVAGKRLGKADDRHLWPEMRRFIAEAEPAFVLAENVPGIVQMELDSVLSDLEAIGYTAWPLVIPACAVDARHRRNRVWIVAALADAAAPGLQHDSQVQAWCEFPGRHTFGSSSRALADPSGKGLSVPEQKAIPGERWWQEGGAASECCRWCPEPDMDRVAYGVHARVDRLKAIGDSIVPQVAYEILHGIRLAMKGPL